MSWFAWWLISGFVLTSYTFWLVFATDCMGDGTDTGLPDVITLPDLLVSLGIFAFGMIVPIFTLIFALGFTWEWAKLSDVVVWRRKEKDDIADLEKKATKLGFKLAPKVVKGLDD